MKEHTININKKYFEPIRDGKISLLIFKNKIISDFSIGDYIYSSFGSYDIKAKISKVYVKAFEDITEEEAQKAGFLTKDFLKEELIKEYDLKTEFSFELGRVIDKELFFIVEINNYEESYSIGNTKFDLYSKDYSREFYNQEYDIQTWRN